jgi:hypothetical protein
MKTLQSIYTGGVILALTALLAGCGGGGGGGGSSSVDSEYIPSGGSVSGGAYPVSSGGGSLGGGGSSGGGGTSTTTISFLPADGYIYGATLSCESATASRNSDNLTFSINSLTPGKCEIRGGYHSINGVQVQNDAVLRRAPHSYSSGERAYISPLSTLIEASYRKGLSLEGAEKRVASLMGVDPSSSNAETILKQDPTKFSAINIAGFEPIKARSAVVSVYTMLEQFYNAGVAEDSIDSAMLEIAKKGSETVASEELDVATILDAVKDINSTGFNNQFNKIADLLKAQEKKIREVNDIAELEQVVSDSIYVANEFEDVTSSSDANSSIEEEFSKRVDEVSGTISYKIVDTAQKLCFDSTSGEQKECTGVGYDADYSGHEPSYSVDGDVVIDNITSLMWMRSSDLDGDGETTDYGDKLTLDEATSYCENLNLQGYDDWRLPDIKTLYSLIKFSGGDPSAYTGSDTSILETFLDSSFTQAFGDMSVERLIDGQFASSTRYVSTTMHGDDTMFGVNFIDGRIKGYPVSIGGNDFSFYVKCVRGNENYGKNSFSDNGDGTITDSATALMWEQDDHPSTNFENAIEICESSTTGGYDDWRLPNAKELQSILDYSRSPDTTSSAAIDPIFNATAITNELGQSDYGYYWSSTTHKSYTGSGVAGAYLSFGRALGYFQNALLDVHGAGAQRSNAKMSENEAGASTQQDASGGVFYYKGPQGDVLRIDNMVRCVRDAKIDSSSNASTPSGYILFSTMGSKTTRLLDTSYEVVKSWESEYRAANASYLHGSNLLRAGLTPNVINGTFAKGGGAGGVIEEFDSSGNVIWSVTLDSDSYTLHHDFKQIDDDTILALSWELRGSDWNEKIVKIDKPSKTITWEWSAMDDGGVVNSSSDSDFIHLNSIDYKNGKILVSSRGQNELWEIDESSKSIVKTYSAGGQLVGQHDASYLESGNILVFNNDDDGSSEVLELDSSDSVIWEYSGDFYSDHISGAQRLENGNTLICSGVEGRFIEVSSDKELLAEYTNAFSESRPDGSSDN